MRLPAFLVFAVTVLAGTLAGSDASARPLCDFESDPPRRWVCRGGAFGVQKTIVRNGKKAGLWSPAKGFSHLHLRDFNPAFGAKSTVNFWMWCEKPLAEGLVLGIGQNLENFAVAPVKLEGKGWNRISIPVARMAVKGLVDWDYVALFAFVYFGEEETNFVIDDLSVDTPEAPRRKQPGVAVNVDPNAREHVLADFETDGDDRHIYFERSGGQKVTAPKPVRSGKHAFCWRLVGHRPFLHFGAVPRNLTPYMAFVGSFYYEGTGDLSIHILFCTTDEHNFQEEIPLAAGKWTEAVIYLADMIDVGEPNLASITAMVFTVQGTKKGNVYFDDLKLTKYDPEEKKDGKKKE